MNPVSELKETEVQIVYRLSVEKPIKDYTYKSRWLEDKTKINLHKKQLMDVQETKKKPMNTSKANKLHKMERNTSHTEYGTTNTNYINNDKRKEEN